MKVLTRQLDGVALDYLVAKLRGYKDIKVFAPSRPGDRGWVEVRFNPEPKASTARYEPTLDDTQCAKIVDELEIGTYTQYPRPAYNPATWYARIYGQLLGSAPSRRVAALRAYVRYSCGLEVELDDYLFRFLLDGTKYRDSTQV